VGVSGMSEKEIIDMINEIFKGLEFDYIEHSERYNDYELHFKGGKYFCLGIRLTADVRQVHVNPKYKKNDGYEEAG